MKKLIYLCLIAFSVSLIHAETQVVEKSFSIGLNPVTGSYEALSVSPSSNQFSNLPVVQAGSTTSHVPSFFFFDPVEDQPFAFSTRIHPRFDDDSKDTARFYPSKLAPNDPNEVRGIGDTQIPTVVGDPENPDHKLNGFFQVLPSMQYFIPQLESGTVTLDSVVFWLYPPRTPAKNTTYFTILPFNKNDFPTLGTDQFDPRTFFSLPYKTFFEDKITDLFPMDPNFVNSKLKDDKISPTSINLKDYSSMRYFDVTTPLSLVIMKDTPGDLKDTLSLVGAWEWTLDVKHCFAGMIKHFPNNNDSIGLLSQYHLVYYNEGNTADSILFNQKWPGLDRNLHINYNFLIYGRFTGELGSSVNEIEASSNTFELEQNSPNPVSTSTKLKFSTNATSVVSLKVYNQLGEIVATLVDETLTPGVYDTNFDASNLAPGLYFYSLTNGNQTKTLPMIITR
ncbi:MAG: T9SS type A sorting domain-containing protein [Chloroherpetonaceae bacterium]